MAAELNGPRLEPPGGQAKRLVVFLHGYGADGNDWLLAGARISTPGARAPRSHRAT